MSTTCVAVVRVDDHEGRTEELAVGGFLAAYCGSTRRSYAADLRLFGSWCPEANLTLFSVRRAHLELFGRWMEETGRMRSTVARRLSTLASFYKYCEQEQLVDRNPALNVRRPKVDYESRTLGLDRNELGVVRSCAPHTITTNGAYALIKRVRQQDPVSESSLAA